jgi:hypothetical protein
VVAPEDAGTEVGQDAAIAADGSEPTLDGAVDAGVPMDSGADAEPPADAAPDGESEVDAGCVRPTDCYVGHHDPCSTCRWPLNYPVCVEGRCGCACDEGAIGAH